MEAFLIKALISALIGYGVVVWLLWKPDMEQNAKDGMSWLGLIASVFVYAQFEFFVAFTIHNPSHNSGVHVMHL